MGWISNFLLASVERNEIELQSETGVRVENRPENVHETVLASVAAAQKSG